MVLSQGIWKTSRGKTHLFQHVDADYTGIVCNGLK